MFYLLFLDEEIILAGGVEVAEVPVVIYSHVRAERMLDIVEVEIAVGAVGPSSLLQKLAKVPRAKIQINNEKIKERKNKMSGNE